MNDNDQQNQPVNETATAETVSDQSTVEVVGERTDTEPQSHEAKKYRTRLREVEAERDQLAATVEALRRAQIDQHIETMGVKAKAVWATGTQPADLLDDDGSPDPHKISAAVAAARAELGIPAQATRAGTAGLHSGTMPRQPVRGGWRDAFTPAKR